MADVEAPAPSAPAPAETPQQPAPSPADGAPSIPRDPEAYAAWRQTGKLPEAPPNGDSATPTQPKKRDSASQPKKGDSATHADNEGQEPERTKDRVAELLAERHALRTELETLKAGKPGAKTDSPPKPAVDAKTDSSPKSESKRPVKPKQDDFDSWDAYESAKDKYDEDLAAYKAQEMLDGHIQQQQKEAQTREMQSRLNEAKERYGAEAEPKIIGTAKTVFDDQAVAPVVKIAMGRSEVIVDALYVLGSDAEDFEKFIDLSKSDPLEAIRKWYTVEALVKEELAKNGKSAAQPSGTPPRGPDGKFLPEAKPARPRTPAPPSELNSGGSPPGDVRAAAVEKGDFRTFQQEGNRRDIARFRGQ